MVKYLENMVEQSTLFYLSEDEKGSVVVRLKKSFLCKRLDMQDLVMNDLSSILTVCPSLEALFLEMLYEDIPGMEVSEKIKTTVLNFASQLYAEDIKQFKDMPTKTRYARLKQIISMPEYTTTSQRVPLHEGLDELLKSKRGDQKGAEDLYCEVLEDETHGRYVHTPHIKRVQCFPAEADILVWAFEEIVNSGKELRLCANCGQLFLFSGTRTKYCSERCSRQYNADNSFWGNDDLKACYNRISATFDRRIKSEATYIYEAESEDETMCGEGMFSENLLEEKQWENRFVVSYVKSDFKIMKVTFLNYKKKKFKEMKVHQKSYENNEITMEQYDYKMKELIAWMETADQCLKNFKCE